MTSVGQEVDELGAKQEAEAGGTQPPEAGTTSSGPPHFMREGEGAMGFPGQRDSRVKLREATDVTVRQGQLIPRVLLIQVPGRGRGAGGAGGGAVAEEDKEED